MQGQLGLKQSQPTLIGGSGSLHDLMEFMHAENDRRWPLYNNELAPGVPREAPSHEKRRRETYGARPRSQSKQQARSRKESRLRTESGSGTATHTASTGNKDALVKKDFLEAVKNHTVYRRDNIVNQLTGKIKRSMDPFLTH